LFVLVSGQSNCACPNVSKKKQRNDESGQTAQEKIKILLLFLID
jgi:hypothetical protein